MTHVTHNNSKMRTFENSLRNCAIESNELNDLNDLKTN